MGGSPVSLLTFFCFVVTGVKTVKSTQKCINSAQNPFSLLSKLSNSCVCRAQLCDRQQGWDWTYKA